MFEVIPSPGTKDQDWQTIKGKIEQVRSLVKTIHIDVVDGKFAPNTTFSDPGPFSEYTKELFFEVHLMVEEPIQYLTAFADAGFRRFIGQIEKMSDQVAFIAKAEALGEVGLALDIDTNPDALKVSIEDLDCLLFMSVKAGHSGQKFMPEVLTKLTQLKKPFDQFPLEVDGGINDQTILQAKSVGATRFVATSFLFNNDKLREQLDILSSLISD